MKKKKYFLLILLSSLFISCKSTKIYTSYEKLAYADEDGETIFFEEQSKTFKEKKPKTKVYNKYNEDKNLIIKTIEKKVTVESKTDYKLLSYSFLLKPFVVLGASTFSLGKCIFLSASAFIFVAIDYRPEWSKKHRIFNFEEDKNKMLLAKEENKIKYYPEFYKPFTKNHIIDETTKSEISYFNKTENKKIDVKGHSIFEYNNTIYVSKEITKDFYSTTYFVRYVGDAISIPIIITSVVAGALVNIAFIN